MNSWFINKFLNIKGREFFLLIVLTLFLTDISILLNIPGFREILSFVYFTVVPGMLILLILKQNKIEFLKKFVLWVGLSVAFLMLVGLGLNTLYPTILEPLSLDPVLLSLNFAIIVLAIIAYKRNEKDFDIKEFLNVKLDLKNKLNFPVLIPLLFPFMMIFGTYLMNIQGNNVILLITLFLIMLYIVLLVYLKDKVPNATYPLSILMIGISLLFLHGLSSAHLMGRDIHKEFYCFQLTLNSFHWDASAFYDTFNVCLSITILPTIYKVLSNINGEYIFKVFFALLGAVSPLAIYLISKKYVGIKYAFFASLLFMSLAFFINSMGSVRQVIAMIFFFIAVFVLFDTEMNDLSRKIIFLILMIATVLSHYTTAYIAFALTVPILLMPFLKSVFNKLLKKGKKIDFTNFSIIIPFLAFVFIWYFIVAQVQLNAGTDLILRTVGVSEVTGTSDVVVYKTDSMVLNMLGMGFRSVPNIISTFVHDAVFIMILIGLLVLIWKYNYYKEKLDKGYILGIFISLILLILIVVTPYLSVGYGAERLFIQTLAFLAPLFIIGTLKFAKVIKMPKAGILIMLVLVLSLFSVNTYLTYHFYGTPHSPYIENDGSFRDEYYIYDQEIIAAKWVKDYGENGSKIYTDAIGYSRFMLAFEPGFPDINSFSVRNIVFKNGYTYLGYANIRKGIIYPTLENPKDRKSYNYVFKDKSKIYDNAYGEIYFD